MRPKREGPLPQCLKDLQAALEATLNTPEVKPMIAHYVNVFFQEFLDDLHLLATTPPSALAEFEVAFGHRAVIRDTAARLCGIPTTAVSSSLATTAAPLPGIPEVGGSDGMMPLQPGGDSRSFFGNSTTPATTVTSMRTEPHVSGGIQNQQRMQTSQHPYDASQKDQQRESQPQPHTEHSLQGVQSVRKHPMLQIQTASSDGGGGAINEWSPSTSPTNAEGTPAASAAATTIPLIYQQRQATESRSPRNDTQAPTPLSSSKQSTLARRQSDHRIALQTRATTPRANNAFASATSPASVAQSTQPPATAVTASTSSAILASAAAYQHQSTTSTAAIFASGAVKKGSLNRNQGGPTTTNHNNSHRRSPRERAFVMDDEMAANVDVKEWGALMQRANNTTNNNTMGNSTRGGRPTNPLEPKHASMMGQQLSDTATPSQHHADRKGTSNNLLPGVDAFSSLTNEDVHQQKPGMSAGPKEDQPHLLVEVELGPITNDILTADNDDNSGFGGVFGPQSACWTALSGKRDTLAQFLMEVATTRHQHQFPPLFDNLFLPSKQMPDLLLDDEDNDVFGLRIRIPDLADEVGTNVSSITNRVCFMVNRCTQSIVTYHACAEDPFDGFEKEWEAGRHTATGVERMSETMIRRVLRTYSKGVTMMQETLDELENRSQSNTLDDTSRVQRLSIVAKKAAVYKRCADATRLTLLEMHDIDWIAPYIQTLCDGLETVISMSDELASNALASIDLTIALSEFQSNTNLKTFTYMTILLQPISVATSWYGMNWANMPELLDDNGYFLFAGLCWAAAILLFLFFVSGEIRLFIQNRLGLPAVRFLFPLKVTARRGSKGRGGDGDEEDNDQNNLSATPSSEERPWQVSDRRLSLFPSFLPPKSTSLSTPQVKRLQQCAFQHGAGSPTSSKTPASSF